MATNVARIFSREAGLVIGFRAFIRPEACTLFVRAIVSELRRLTHASRQVVEQYVRPDDRQVSTFAFSVRVTGLEHSVHVVSIGCRMMGKP